jgi:glycosyltransferase involved in cell wall biosynthesis
MRNVLLIARNFAPVSHVSAERATKLAKYLPRFGWRPTVLTGAHATAGLAEDPALLDQVSGVPLIRTRAPEFSLFYASRSRGKETESSYRGAPKRGSWHPKSWLVPDSQVLWYPFAVRAALRAARDTRWDAIIATSFPPTALLVAHTVSARLGIPYIADFRDAWTTHYQAPRRPAPIADLERRLERRMIRDAAAVVSVDARFVEHVYTGIPQEDRPPLHVIRNGYDEDDFEGVEPAALPQFSIVHTGQLRQPPLALWEALGHALRDRPELRGKVHLWQIGFVEPGTERVLKAAPDGVTVHYIPPVSQREAIGFMLGADLLLVEEYGSAWPSKTLQYLRAGRPILAFVPRDGMIREVLETVPLAHVMAHDESARAGHVIAELAALPRTRAGTPPAHVTAYSRREIARRYAALLDEVSKASVQPGGGLRDQRLGGLEVGGGHAEEPATHDRLDRGL